jgi:predicted nucleic acid-binding Zn ribbon protein
MQEHCLVCGKKIYARKIYKNEKYHGHPINKKYCSAKCGYLAFRKRQNKKYDIPLSKGTIGALHELVVSAELMRKGFHVFRAQSPSCPCDLIAMNQGDILRIEVTTGTYFMNGKTGFPPRKDEHKFDILAIVFHDGKILWKKPDEKLGSLREDVGKKQ